ncbi:MAG: hypothetical protein IJ124_06080 [Clostridia bacterium]|nr:hypothetical protein [Clostridia bacterium]
MNAFSGYPASYQPMYPQNYGYQQPQQQQIQQPTMTPPTRYASIVQVDSEQAAADYPVGAGQAQMMMARDDSFIAIKSVLANGEPTLDVYVKRPPAPPKPAFDPAVYVTKEELETRLRAILTPQAAGMKEEKHSEPV